MDPNACLEAIRRLVADIDKETDQFMLAQQAEELACLISGIDDWLKRGGVKPRDWSHKN